MDLVAGVRFGNVIGSALFFRNGCDFRFCAVQGVCCHAHRMSEASERDQGEHTGSGNVWLAPVSLAEVHDRGAGAFMKPQPFTLALSNCQLRHDGGAASQDEVRRVSVRWVDGFLLTAVGNENAGYLANTLPDGAQNIYLALSTNDNNTLDKSNKIVPADPQQNQVRLQESAVSGGLFTYYVGYVSPTPKSATSGPITSWATWELVYN